MATREEFAMQCVWTNTTSGDLKEVEVLVPDRFGRNPRPATFHVLPQHEDEFRDWAGHVVTRLRLFLVLVVAATVLTILGGALLDLPGLGIGLAALGLVIIALPFATPETGAVLGLATSIRIARTAGAGLLVGGLGLMALALA